MAGSAGSKGNPATKRMMNARLKAKRAESWARGGKRKIVNAKANEARRQANLGALGDQYNASATRTKTWIERRWDGGKLDIRERTREVSESPSRQRRRIARLISGITK